MTPTNDLDALAAEIRHRLQEVASGNTAEVRAVRRSFSRRLTGAPPSDVVILATRLVAGDSFLERFVAHELVFHHREALASLTPTAVEGLAGRMDSWGAVDEFACYIAGPAWRRGQIGDDMVGRWAKSADRWWRRAALVSTVPLNVKAQGGRGDPDRTLSICGALVVDRDDMVVKALSWALRALCARDPESVRRFLEEQDGRVAARVRREVTNKLTTGLKQPRSRRSRVA